MKNVLLYYNFSYPLGGGDILLQYHMNAAFYDHAGHGLKEFLRNQGPQQHAG